VPGGSRLGDRAPWHDSRVSAQNSNGGINGTAGPSVTSIPLSEEDSAAGGEQSIGTLVREAMVQLSTLVRSEIELAKTEILGEVRKAVKGSIYFVLALTVLGFSTFFLFFTLAEALAQLGLFRWVAYGIVFLLMLLVAALLGLLGFRRVRKIRAPRRTIDSLREAAQITRRRPHSEDQ
jgi:uncharacterized membrane protein YqjE